MYVCTYVQMTKYDATEKSICGTLVTWVSFFSEVDPNPIVTPVDESKSRMTLKFVRKWGVESQGRGEEEGP